jgi:hypothetical protein
MVIGREGEGQGFILREACEGAFVPPSCSLPTALPFCQGHFLIIA